jgi:nucleoside-diphosphate-sugar epimerase
MKVVVIGCGWLGLQLAAELVAAGHQVYASRRSAQALATLPAGITGFVLDLNITADKQQSLPYLHDACVICAISPGATSQSNYIEALQQLAVLASAAGSRQIIHFSSTGIYQGLSGEVDETAKLITAQPRVRLLLQGEQVLGCFRPTLTLRLAGLMGPGRHPGHFAAGRQLPDANGAVNMVHVADIIAAVIRLLSMLPCYGVYNLSCPGDVKRQDFYQQAAQSAKTVAASFTAEAGTGRKVKADSFIRQFNFQYRFKFATAALLYCHC